MDKSLSSGRNLIMNLPREQVLSELFDISPYSSDSEQDKSLFSKREQAFISLSSGQEELDKCAPSGAPSDKVDNSLSSEELSSEELEEEQEPLKEVVTYYLLYKEIDKKFNIIISKRKQKKYFACLLCDEDKDLIMEFENHFECNVDNIKVPCNYNYCKYRIHNLTKDKLKREMKKFIKSLGVGYQIEYFSTVNNWEGKG